MRLGLLGSPGSATACALTSVSLPSGTDGRGSAIPSHQLRRQPAAESSAPDFSSQSFSQGPGVLELRTRQRFRPIDGLAGTYTPNASQEPKHKEGGLVQLKGGVGIESIGMKRIGLLDPASRPAHLRSHREACSGICWSARLPPERIRPRGGKRKEESQLARNGAGDSQIDIAQKALESVRDDAADEYLVVSVESRKGGVGKTTTAFCLADLLVRHLGYVVLLVDGDLAGTDAAVAADCRLWRDLMHVLRGSGGQPVNALDLFETLFLSGQGVPSLSFLPGQEGPAGSGRLRLDSGRVNVVGSNLYVRGSDARERPVIEPELLFDGLHGFWFTEFLEEFCNHFASAARELPTPPPGVAIVIDNAPGFVGVAPAIQEWITNLGPQRGKTLFVTSLDAQDLIAVGEAVQFLSDLYADKVAAARLHRSIVEQPTGKAASDMPPPSARQLSYLLEIAQQAQLDAATVGTAHSLSEWYGANGLQKEEILASRLSYAAGVLINRVPPDLFSSAVSYNLGPVLQALGAAAARGAPLDELGKWMRRARRSSSHIPLILDLLAPGSDGARARMVASDTTLEAQFLNLSRRGASSIPESQLAALRRRQSEILERPMPGWGRELSSRSLATAASHCQTDLESTVGELGEVVPATARYLLPKWLPAKQLGDLGGLLADNLLTTRTSRPGTFDAARMACRKGVLDLLAAPALGSTREPSPEVVRFLVETAFAALTIARRQLVHGESRALTRILAVVSAMQLGSAPKSEGRGGNRKGRPLFHAEDYALAERAIAVPRSAWRLLREDASRPSLTRQGLVKLYSMLCQAQARLLDLAPDTSFLVGYLGEMAKRAASEPQLPPGEEELVDSVLLRKELPHDEAMARLMELRRSGSYIAGMSRVIEAILEDWAVGEKRA